MKVTDNLKMHGNKADRFPHRRNQRTNGPVNAHLRPSYHFFDVKAYVSKINLAVK